MSKDRIMSFARELATLVKECREMEAFLDAAKARLDVASAANESKTVEQLTAQRTQVRQRLEQATALACQRANRSDLAGCERLLGQLDARFGELESYEKAVHAMEAQFEMAAAMGEFEEGAKGASRSDVETVMAEARKRLETQLSLLAALVPEKPVILSL